MIVASREALGASAEPVASIGFSVLDGAFGEADAAWVEAVDAGIRLARDLAGTDPERMARFFDDVTEMGIDGISVSPGYAYERAPDQQHFLNKRKTKELFRGIFARGRGKGWKRGELPIFQLPSIV